jgi:hypothetical protein
MSQSKIERTSTMAPIGPKPALTVTIGNPVANAQINIGEELTVTGLAAGRGAPEPSLPQAVTVQLGDLAPVRAVLHPPRSGSAWIYSAVFQTATLPAGPTLIVVNATFDSNEHVAVNEQVIASFGGAPLESTFNATATLKTSSSIAAGPYSDTLVIGALFSGDRKTVVINFPPLSVGGATVTLVGGGTGTFEVSSVPSPPPSRLPEPSGAMTVPVTLKCSNLENGDSTLSLVMTTGAEQSPKGVFKDTGTPMDPAGKIVLIGDGSFEGGNILGGDDASLVIEGTFSPVPFLPSVTNPLP